MYAPPPAEDASRYQAKMIVNMVVAVFLIVGLLLVMQYFHFLFLDDIPLVGGWLMDMYERIFGVPKVLILHGKDSIGDWTELQSSLSKRLIFYSEDIDVDKFSAGLSHKLGQYGLIIIEDAKRLDKDKLLNIEEYVKGGGNIIWVGDAGTQGLVEYDGRTLENQTGWIRDVVCIDEITRNPCNCNTVGKEESTCKYLPDASEQEAIDFTSILGAVFKKDELGVNPEVEIVDRGHWSVSGIRGKFTLQTVNRIASVDNTHKSSLVANINMGDEVYPGLIVNDPPGAWGSIVYFAYPPEETMELVLPLVERLRY